MNWVDLRSQAEWFGTTLKTFNILVCRRCYDTPQEQLRAIVLPADPVPITNPRIEYFRVYEVDGMQVSGANTIDPITGLPVNGGAVLVDQSGNILVTQQTGAPPYSTNQQPGTSITVPDDVGGNNPGLPYNNTTVPQTGPIE